MAFDFAALYQQALDYLKTNQFAGGGLVVGITGAALAFARHLPRRFAQWAWRHATVEIEVTSKDNLFDALDYWMAQKGFVGRPRNFRAGVFSSPPTVVYQDAPSSVSPSSDRKRTATVHLSPGAGRHMLWHRGRPILVERSYLENKNDRYGMQLERFVLNFFTRDEGRARELLAEAVAACAPAEKSISIYTADNRSWVQRAAVPVRCPGSLVLRDGLFEELAEDVRRFFERKDMYRNVGIPHRRGYLLTGPPGNGKTTTILVLAGIFAAPLCIADLASPVMSDDKLRDLMASAPAGAFFLFEDIDAMFSDGAPTARRLAPEDEREPWEVGERRQQLDSAGLSLSGLLNALDGVASPSGRVVFMSTNHPEKLAPALIGPGRVDRRVELANATGEQAARMFRRFFDHLGEVGDEVARFADLVGTGSVSMAAVQGVLIESEGCSSRAVRLAERLSGRAHGEV